MLEKRGVGESAGSAEAESFKDVVPFHDKLADIRSFWRTREAIFRGEPLSGLSKSELKEQGLMGPWKFNVVQSTASALPIALMVQFGILHDDSLSALFPSLPEFGKVFGVLRVFILPFVLLLTVVAIGMLYRPAPEELKEEVKRKRKLLGMHYLYLDAAHGLYPQCLVALARAGLNIGELSFVLLAWQLVITLRTIPSDLFLSGASLDEPQRLMNLNEGPKVPWLRYIVAVLIAVPVIAFLLVMFVLFISFVIAAICQLVHK